jgi:pimeloyl-ACP methyl ester carboxylesterase
VSAVTIESKYVDVDGIRTHYLEGGAGPTLVLLHSGEFGGCAEISWEFNLEPLARRFHVVAPDWLGFGRTDKVHDFVDGRGRRARHMKRFLETVGIDEADFVGNSFAGGMLARAAVEDPMQFPIRRLVLASGGGFSPDNEYRRALLAYDGTVEAMQRLLRAMLYDPKWADDAEYVRKRHELSLIPGAWECQAAPRFRAPIHPERQEFGQPDTIPYERIRVPTLVMAGAQDRLRLPGYAGELAKRIPDAQLLVFENCGHCPNIEQAERFNQALIAFLTAPTARAEASLR